MKKRLVIISLVVCFLLVTITASVFGNEEKIKVMKYEEKSFGRISFSHEIKENKKVIVEEITPKEFEFRKSLGEKIERVRQIKPLLQDSVLLIGADNFSNLNINSINLTGRSNSICILDSGIDRTHPDLQDNYLDGWDFGEGDNDPTDHDGHGTHVAGIVAANGNIRGVSSETGLVIVKVFNDAGSGDTSMLRDGIQYCIDNSEEYNISVITMSLAIVYPNNSEIPYTDYCDEFYPILTPKINEAVQKNITFTIASGNDLSSGYITAPACIQNATPVGAVNKTDTIFYNRNSLVQLLAPGVNINSTMPTYPVFLNTEYSYTQNYYELSGTSMATPMVAGTIAIINQVLNLTGQSKTPQEIETILYDTGKKINDSGYSNINYSRINVYSAILSLDNIAPNITLEYPTNNKLNLTQNQTFSFNASDWQLKNATFYLWNSTELYNTSSINLTGTENASSFFLTDLPYASYEWNIEVYDENNNSAFAETNYSLTIGGISVSVNEPLNNSYQKFNSTTFNCSALSDENYDLTNITYYLLNSSDELVDSNVTNISGTENSSSWTYEFPTNETYFWSCVAFNNNSQNVTSENYSVTYDITYPEISPISVSVSSSSATLTWNTAEETNVSIFSENNVTNSSYSLNHSEIISGLSASTTYTYNLTYCDRAGNCNSTNGTFTTSAAPVVIRSSGGGGGGGGGKTITINDTQISRGYSKRYYNGEKLSFSLNGENHSIKLNKIINESVNLTIQSEPINFILSVGESKKMNLSSEKYFDLIIKLENISQGMANISLIKINESIFKPIKPVDNENDKPSTPKENQESEKINWTLWVIGVICVFLIFGGLIERRSNWKRLKTEMTNKNDEKTKAKTKRKR